MTIISAPFKEMRVDAQGRVVIPAEVRQQLSLKEGERLIPRIENGQLILERREDIARRLMSIFPKGGPSLVDELIAERRAEAARE